MGEKRVLSHKTEQISSYLVKREIAHGSWLLAHSKKEKADGLKVTSHKSLFNFTFWFCTLIFCISFGIIWILKLGFIR